MNLVIAMFDVMVNSRTFKHPSSFQVVSRP